VNPNALVLWAILTIIGYLCSGTLKGALLGLLAGLIISLLASLVPTRRGRW
jgi:uncharacterized membrane protein